MDKNKLPPPPPAYDDEFEANEESTESDDFWGDLANKVSGTEPSSNISQQDPISPNIEFANGISATDFLTDVEQILKGDESVGLFTLKTASEWIDQAKNRPIPEMLFAEFWFEGELCILFADTNLGKSIVAVQIGDSISKGASIPGFRLQTQSQPILYFDFELSDKQFENRYSKDYENHYNFHNHFIRVEMNPDATLPDNQDFETFLYHSLEDAIIKTGTKVLIIDNLTYLKNETEKAKDALPLMKHLKALKSKYELSILVLAHTPKRDLSKPISRNDLSGSKMLINFCDSSFAIGESHTDKNLRYLKQIKARNTEIIYDAENVCICQIDKPFNFLMFEFLNFGNEREHLRQPTKEDEDVLLERIVELKQQGRSFREIGKELGITHMRASRILNKKNKL